jgi:hypothetical protein
MLLLVHHLLHFVKHRVFYMDLSCIDLLSMVSFGKVFIYIFLLGVNNYFIM